MRQHDDITAGLANEQHGVFAALRRTRQRRREPIQHFRFADERDGRYRQARRFK